MQDSVGTLFLSLLQTVQKENFKPQSSYILSYLYSNTVGHQTNENSVAGGGRMNFAVVNISVTAEVAKVEIDHDATAQEQLLII